VNILRSNVCRNLAPGSGQPDASREVDHPPDTEPVLALAEEFGPFRLPQGAIGFASGGERFEEAFRLLLRVRFGSNLPARTLTPGLGRSRSCAGCTQQMVAKVNYFIANKSVSRVAIASCGAVFPKLEIVDFGNHLNSTA
jgi:hypothetical protein